MTLRTVAGVFLLGFVSFAAGKDAPEKVLPRIADSKELSVEMAKALVAGDGGRFTALAATREEMVRLLETALHPASSEERQEQKDKVEGIVAERGEDFDKFQAMKKEVGVRGGSAVRFELIDVDPIREKDGMKKSPPLSGPDVPGRRRRERGFLPHWSGRHVSLPARLGLHLRLRRNQKRDAEEIMAFPCAPSTRSHICSF